MEFFVHCEATAVDFLFQCDTTALEERAEGE